MADGPRCKRRKQANPRRKNEFGSLIHFRVRNVLVLRSSTYPVPFPLGIAQDLSELSGFLLLSWIRGKDVTSELVSLLITLETVMLIEIRQKFLMKRGRTKLKIKNTGNK
ncbi:hypothetical protein Anapl_08136 [Anas platyrhynchos]|uniref:Zinc finger E-box-binding homeobox 2 n=1 Tax=Anas platyrhynchos TaxID=8839 RepID=R0M2Q6_ANAPL|nr:hypothetical protein Anapl_08136 [Anas platyrhynchos]